MSPSATRPPRKQPSLRRLLRRLREREQTPAVRWLLALLTRGQRTEGR